MEKVSKELESLCRISNPKSKRYVYLVQCTECKRSVRDVTFYKFLYNRIYLVFTSFQKARCYLGNIYCGNKDKETISCQTIGSSWLKVQYSADSSGVFTQLDYDILKHDIK